MSQKKYLLVCCALALYLWGCGFEPWWTQNSSFALRLFRGCHFLF